MVHNFIGIPLAPGSSRNLEFDTMASDCSRCRCGTFLTVCVISYIIVMVFKLGRNYEEYSKVLKIKGRVARLGKASGKEHSSIGVNFLKMAAPERSAGASAKIQEEPKKIESVPMNPAGKNVLKVQTGGEKVAKMQRPADPVVPPRAKVRKLIIVTYARSGSSFLGQLLQQHPEAFYVHEPLFQMQRNYLEGLSFAYLDGRNESNMDPLEYWGPGSMCIRVLPQIGNCQFQLLDMATLTQDNMRSSESTKPFMKCLKKKLNPKKTNLASVAEGCIDTINNPCEDARVVAVKVLRLSMDQLEQIMMRDFDVKVIYLLRDPRGSLMSRSDNDQLNWKNVEGTARYLCGRMYDDLAYAKTVAKQFSKRLLLVRYEEIAENPEAAAKFVLNFLDLKMTDSIRKYIKRIASTGYSANCRRCPPRRNIMDSAYRWRDKMTFPNAKTIEETCSKVFDIMGYRRLHNGLELLNRNVTLKSKEFGEGFMVMKPSALR